MVAVNGEITPALAEEGLARELVHRIQGLRRAANFEVTDHIETWYDGPDELADVMRGNFSGYIREETLSDLLEAGPPPEGAKSETAKVEGQEITLAVPPGVGLRRSARASRSRKSPAKPAEIGPRRADDNPRRHRLGQQRQASVGGRTGVIRSWPDS